MTPKTRWTGIVVALIALNATESASQTIAVSALSTHIGHEQLSTMNGASLGLQFGAPTAWTFRAGIERSTGSGMRLRGACVDPTFESWSCGNRFTSGAFQDRVSITGPYAGVGRRVLTLNTLAVSLFTDAAYLQSKSRPHAESVAWTEVATARHALVRGGASLEWTPIRTWPVALQLSASLGVMNTLSTDGADATRYKFLGANLNTRNMQFGASWSPGSGAR